MDAGTALATVGKDYLPTMLRNAAQKLAAAETAAEVLEARAAAAELYDEAKKAARLAKAKGAHDTVITTIYRVQADGLEIEAAAKRRLADEYDAAQAAGEIKAPNNAKTNSKPEAVSAGAIGLTHKQVHDARQLRDAEARDPGVTKRTLDTLVEQGREPTRAAVRRELYPSKPKPIASDQSLWVTPASLAKFDGAPVFRLRASTTRDKRFHRRLLLEHGIRYHDRDTIRAEVLKGLEQLWDADAFAEHSPVIKALWEARDDYELQLKDDPSLAWSYAPQIEDAVDELVRKVSQEWKPLRTMIADNADYGAMSGALIVAVTVLTFTGLSVKALKDRGYTTVETAEAIETALSALEVEHGVPEGTAWAELIVACSQRMYLTEEERGNSGSQSPSPTAPAPLSETNTSGKDGKSPELELSSETPATE